MIVGRIVMDLNILSNCKWCELRVVEKSTQTHNNSISDLLPHVIKWQGIILSHMILMVWEESFTTIGCFISYMLSNGMGLLWATWFWWFEKNLLQQLVVSSCNSSCTILGCNLKAKNMLQTLIYLLMSQGDNKGVHNSNKHH